MTIKNKVNKTALVTGGTTGIGFELAKILATEGYNIVIVARNKDRLKKAKQEINKLGVNVEIMSKDLSDISAADEIYRKIKNIDLLVNNAGFGLKGNFSENDLSKETGMMETNMVSLVKLTKYYVKDMIKKGNGKIINVASVAAFQPGPNMAIYYATKAFVLSFSQALSKELEGTNIIVSCLCPGPTATEFIKNARMQESQLFKSNAMDAKTVAQIGYNGLKKGKRVVIPGFKNKLLVFLAKIMPTPIVLSMVNRLHKDV